MKKLTIVFITLFSISMFANAQSIEKLFEKYADDERFSYVSVGKGASSIASQFGNLPDSEKSLMSKMKGIKILSLENNASQKLADSFIKDLDKVIEGGNYETLAEIRDKGERMHIYTQVKGKDNAEMLMVMRDQKEITLIWLSGKMTKEELDNIISE